MRSQESLSPAPPPHLPGSARILIVDDEPNIRSGLARGLAQEAGQIELAENAREALEKFTHQDFQLVIADLRLPGEIDGLELVTRIRRFGSGVPVIVITAHGTVETAVDAMRRGAFDFITKPIDLNLIRQQVRKALDHHRLQSENRVLRDQLADAGELPGIIGTCSAMQEVLRQVRQVADTDATVLIEGESGTGKELIARALHDLSGRSGGPFIAINIGALPDTLLESELFGHERGAFSGANRQKPGCFEQAVGGTLFLDEVTEMSAKSQVDLLRVLENGTFNRLGGESLQTTDARIVSATNKEIGPMIDEGLFREDLYYRLNVVPITIPPLRQRREDIPLLADHFLSYFCQRHRRPPKRFSDDVFRRLAAAQWPGNVRQLRNVVERLVVTVSDATIELSDLPAELTRSAAPQAGRVQRLAEVTECAERGAIEAALAQCDFHRERTAAALGISVRTLHYKMNRYSLH